MSESGKEEEKLQNLPQKEEESTRKIELNPETLDKKEQDEADARGFLESLSPKKKQSAQFIDDEDEKIIWEPGCHKDAEEYNMRHRRRGVALIFNHKEFSKMAPRNGAKKDCEDLQKAVAGLGFEVRIHEDLAYRQLKGILEETSKEDHSDADCLLVVVMTHGEPGVLFAKDFPYKEEDLWRRFTGENCASLVGKPKLFMIQACRGDQVDSGIRIATTATDSVSTTYMIPRQADILLSYSTVPGYYSWRNPTNGSWYIQALCAELSANGRKRDLMTLLTFVNRRVAIDYLSMVPGDHRKDMKNQMPAITSMLTRLVYFHENSGRAEKKSRICN